MCLTCKSLGLFCWHGSEVSEVGLVSYEHYHNVAVSMVAEFAQPSLHVLVGQMFRDVIHEQSSDSTTVISTPTTVHGCKTDWVS